MIVHKIVPPLKRKRVAAYARVSTLTDEQEESFETQATYYTKLISMTNGWEFVGIYADQGITGHLGGQRSENPIAVGGEVSTVRGIDADQ